MLEAAFVFSGDLDYFLMPDQEGAEFRVAFHAGQSVKHLIESMHIPHTEVGQILVNGQPVSFEYLVADQDKVYVMPISTNVEICVSNSSEPKFVLDNHLGRLASYLRMLGFDTLYENNFQDSDLAELSSTQERILLTRDRGLLMRKVVQRGCFIRSQKPLNQVSQVVDRYQLVPLFQPFKRCQRCNHILLFVEKEAVIERLEPLTRKYFTEFSQCSGCHQIYWKGSHYNKMLAIIDWLRGN